MRELYARAAKTAAAAPSSRDFAFMLGPRINASGRIASGMEALELILCDDREIVRECARIVDMRNHERKEVEQRMVAAALEKVVPGAPAQVIDLPEGHPGVAGIIASRVMERLSSEPGGAAVPVCIVAGGKGSARAPAGVNIRDAMEFCSEMLERFGGHAAAGGFLVKNGMIDAFRERLCSYCRDLADASAEAVGETGASVDAWLSPKDLTVDLAAWVARMEPFGEGNPEPVFGLRGVELADAKPMGIEGRHLSLAFRDRAVPRAVWWNHGDEVEKLRAAFDRRYDITFKIALSDYGELHTELRLMTLTGEK
jgi:single-stranded-DNA-specific exonuclease